MWKSTGILVGLGSQAINDHIPSLLRRSDVEIIGACDPSVAAHQLFKDTFPTLKDITLTNDLDQLLNKVKPQFAVIAVPHNYYYDIVAKLCKYRIHFLKEKPLARNLSEAHTILSIPGFKELGFIATQRRYGSIYQKAKEAIREAGDLYLFHAVYKLNVNAPNGGWRGQRSIAGGGCLIDMGYHLVDQLLWWFGMPQKIHAQISSLAVPNSDYDAEDSASIAFRYSSGLHGTLLISRAAGEKCEEYELYGSRGYILGSKKKIAIHDRSGSLMREVAAESTADMLDRQLAFFISRIRQNEDFSDIQQDHLMDMKFIERCYRDAADQPTVDSKVISALEARELNLTSPRTT